MYYVVGPVVALLISLKFSKDLNDKHQKEYQELLAKVELVEKRNTEMDKEMLQKVMTTVLPIAKAVNKLNNEVGIR
jgi:diadenosine tetraphosphate (Ap4A) HIT family hydrolase|tara:strand:- start:243 stop:470 length:228 start_codon:yes stop_codon:yes gene_type:complete